MASGGAARKFYTGAQRVATPRELDAFVAGAKRGERFVYCEAPDLIRGETADHARELGCQGYVTTHHERRAGGGWSFFVQRTPKPVAALSRKTAMDDEALETIFRALKRAANLRQRCPSDAELAQLAGLDTRYQAQWRVRKLAELGMIQSTLVYEDNVPSRVVTIVDTGKFTAMPPKWAALQRAAERDVSGKEEG